MRVAPICSAAFLLLLPCLAAAQQSAPSGAAVYKQRCAGCHDGSLPRMPSRQALGAMSPEHIESELASFSMRRQGASLSPAERRAVAEFLTGRPAGSYRAPIAIIPKSAYCTAASSTGDPLNGASWNGWGIDLQNTRHQPAAAAGLTANDVPRLKLKWSFGFAGASASGSQVSIVGSRVFVGSRNGVMYALDRQTGCLVWAFEADAGTRSTPVVVRAAGPNAATVYFGDAHAQVYALDAATGALKWKVKVEEHLDAMITGGVVFHDNRLYVPVSSLEEGTAVLTSYECCTFRGSVVSLDAATGKQIWKTYTIPRTPEPAGKNSVGTQLRAPSGAAVWSAPALDPERNRLYITTGDSYSVPAAPESDSIMALAMDTGRVLWIRQTLASDAWNTACLGTTPAEKVNCPTQSGPDHDFGSSPALVTTPNGQRVLLAGQKSGALSASTRTPAMCSGRRRSEKAACSAASSGDSPSIATSRTCRSRARSRRNPDRQVVSLRSTSRTEAAAGQRRLRPTRAGAGKAATPRSRPRCHRFLAPCSQAASTVTSGRTTAAAARCCST